MAITIIRTAKRNPPGPPRKLSPDQEMAMVRRYKLNGEKRKDLCKEYGITPNTFHNIIARTRLTTLPLGQKPQTPPETPTETKAA